MIERPARPFAVLSAIVLLSVSPMSSLSGQAGGEGKVYIAQAIPTFPPITPKGAGTVNAPEGGYVPGPDSTPAGTAYPALIPADEFDRAYWELFDRDKNVTVTGKVSKVTWTHPNVYIFLKASGIEWAVEANYTQFKQSSVTPAVQIDQTIAVSGFLAKENPMPKWPVKSAPQVASYQRSKHLMRAAEITTAYGQKLRMGRPLTKEEEDLEGRK